MGSSCDFPVDKQNCPNSTDVTVPRFHAVLNFFRTAHRLAVRTDSGRKFKARGRRRRSRYTCVCAHICMSMSIYIYNINALCILWCITIRTLHISFFKKKIHTWTSPTPPFEAYGLETFCLRSHLTRLELTPMQSSHRIALQVTSDTNLVISVQSLALQKLLRDLAQCTANSSLFMRNHRWQQKA